MKCVNCVEDNEATHEMITALDVLNVCCKCHEVCQLEGWHEKESEKK